MKFSYLIEKIEACDFESEPYKHIYLQDFFSPEHFEQLLSSKQIDIKQAATDEELLDDLQGLGFEAIPFPGTTTDLKHYLSWRKDSANKHSNVEICEGFGVTLRLTKPEPDSIISEINEFFNSPEFLGCIAKKFDVPLEETYPDNGLQKYLDGYEISPHPDICKKALTYMINVNPSPKTEEIEYHTHYMKFRPSHEYVQRYWEGNTHHDRCWVPWEWCQTEKMQKTNNSIVIFSPAADTLHAVKADYNHLETQRTQFYGNLWYNENKTEAKPNWRDFVIEPTAERMNYVPLKKKLASGVRAAYSKIKN